MVEYEAKLTGTSLAFNLRGELERKKCRVWLLNVVPLSPGKGGAGSSSKLLSCPEATVRTVVSIPMLLDDHVIPK